MAAEDEPSRAAWGSAERRGAEVCADRRFWAAPGHLAVDGYPIHPTLVVDSGQRHSGEPSAAAAW